MSRALHPELKYWIFDAQWQDLQVTTKHTAISVAITATVCVPTCSPSHSYKLMLLGAVRRPISSKPVGFSNTIKFLPNIVGSVRHSQESLSHSHLFGICWVSAFLWTVYVNCHHLCYWNYKHSSLLHQNLPTYWSKYELFSLRWAFGTVVAIQTYLHLLLTSIPKKSIKFSLVYLYSQNHCPALNVFLVVARPKPLLTNICLWSI